MKNFYKLFFSVTLLAWFSLLPAMAQKTILETFEDSSKVPVWMNAHQGGADPEIVENPLRDGINYSDSVLLWVKLKSAPVYSAAMTEIEAYDIEFKEDATFIHVKMLKDNTDPCALQVIRTEDGMSEAGKYKDPPDRIPCPFPGEWVDYVFDFSAPEATAHTWSRFYFMAVMNATEEGGWAARELPEDVNVYIDEIIIDSDPNPYTTPLNAVHVDAEGNISYILNNPVTTEMVFSGIGKVQEIMVYDMNGTLVRHLGVAGEDTYRLPVSDLANGIYLVSFRKQDGVSQVSKVVKQ